MKISMACALASVLWAGCATTSPDTEERLVILESDRFT